MTSNRGPVLALDIGGTKLAAGVVDADGRVVASSRVPTPPGAGAETLWQAVVDLLDAVAPAADVPDPTAVGVGCGGPMTWPAGAVSPVNIPGWRGFPLRDRLRERFPAVPVRIHNDAIALAVAEHWRGAGQGLDNLLGMVVSTGVGGGLVLGGRLIDGGTGNAGHVGHVVVDPTGPDCACGGRGCLEAIARGPAIAAWAVEQGWRPRDPSGETTARTLADDARRGDPVAVAAFARAGRAVGVAVASAATLCDLDVVVVGGGVAQTGDLLLAPLRASFAEHAGLAFARRVRIVPAALGPDAGLVGAAALVLAGDRYWNGG